MVAGLYFLKDAEAFGGMRKLEEGLYASTSSRSFLLEMMMLRASRPTLITLRRSQSE